MLESLPDDEFYAKLGHFIQHFAMAEGLLRRSLRITMKLSDATSRTLLSGARSDTLIGFWRRHYDASNQKLPKNLDVSLKQLAKITNLRNKLVHFTLQEDEIGLLVSNKSTVASPMRVDTRRISGEVLVQASTDLVFISITLLSICGQNKAYENLAKRNAASGYEFQYKS